MIIDGQKVIVNDLFGKKVELRGAENLNLENYNNDISLVKYVYANTILDKEDKKCKVFYQFMQFVNGMLWFSSTEGHRYLGFSNVQGNLFEAIANREHAVIKKVIEVKNIQAAITSHNTDLLSCD